MLGGKIWLESEQTDLLAGIEGGSTFWFTIPFKRAEIKNKMRKKEVLPLEEINLDKQFKILVAEDDDPSRILISMVLKKFGREIIYTRTGQETVEACRTSPDIELVLMDIQMPEMNGYEATREIRKFNRDIIIIAQTAYALTGDREKALDAGCNDYISKPIDKNKLGAMISKYLITDK
jgi:CheY-like chemotaxis protein